MNTIVALTRLATNQGKPVLCVSMTPLARPVREGIDMVDPPAGPGILHSEGRSAQELVADLGLVPGLPVLVIVGGAASLDAHHPLDHSAEAQDGSRAWRRKIAGYFEHSVGPVVVERGVVVLTGGTAAGVMSLAGEFLADSARLLVGVAPARMVQGLDRQAELESRHHNIVLTPGDRWGTETECLFRLAEAITGGVAPGVLLLGNGGDIAQRETRRFLRAGWPGVVMPRTGGRAEQILRVVGGSQSSSEWGSLKDADVEALAIEDDVARQQLSWRLGSDDLLKAAWTRFSAFDTSSNRLKRAAGRTGALIAFSTFLLLFLVLLLVQFSVLRWTGADGLRKGHHTNAFSRFVVPIAHALVLALPVAVAVAVSVGSFLTPEHRQRAARAAAESLKRAIYRYRAAVDQDGARASKRLALTLSATDDAAISSGIALAAERESVVRARPPGIDPDELAPLTATAYLKHRVDGQLLWFQSAAKSRSASDHRFVFATVAAGSLSTVLVGTRFAVWVAFLLLLAAAFIVHRQRLRTKDEVAGYDRAVADLDGARIDWVLRDADGVAEPSDLVRLVDAVEEALERESQGWEEIMRRAAYDASRYGSPGRT